MFVGAITELADDPYPATSKALARPGQPRETSVSEDDAEDNYALRRIRLDRWRIVYAITVADQAIDILAVRKRPPYDYGDLAALLEGE